MKSLFKKFKILKFWFFIFFSGFDLKSSEFVNLHISMDFYKRVIYKNKKFFIVKKSLCFFLNFAKD